MKNYILVAAGVVLFGLQACKKNGSDFNSDLKISFQSQAHGNDYALEENFTNSDDVGMAVETFQFYLSDITLINSDGDAHVLSEIELFVTNANGLAALDFKAPHGQYKSIQFGVGVKKSLNEADPSTYSEEGHPLNTLNNTYWGWTSMYRFIMTEGRFDSDLDGTTDGTFAYHTGREESYRNFTINHSFEIDKKANNSLAFNIDLNTLFSKSGNAIDVPTESYYHGSEDNIDISIRLSDNMLSAISIRN